MCVNCSWISHTEIGWAKGGNSLEYLLGGGKISHLQCHVTLVLALVFVDQIFSFDFGLLSLYSCEALVSFIDE